MTHNASKIFQEFRKGEIEKADAIKFFLSIIEHSEEDSLREESFKFFEQVGENSDEIFFFLENLLISDSNPNIRIAALRYLINAFPLEKVFKIIKWAINYERDYSCFINLIWSLARLNSDEARRILTEEILKIKKRKKIFEGQNIGNKLYKSEIKKITKSQPLTELSLEYMAEILINFHTVANLKQKFFNVYYELENGVVTTLDLSDIEYEVRGWRADFKNNIKDLSEIEGLNHLTHLKTLYLSNNQLKDIEYLIELKELKYLHIANNNLTELKNLDYIRQMGENGLKYINICKNGIAKKVKHEKFNPKLEIECEEKMYLT